ncbi:hypothetical protein U3A58_05210 [Algoriphagus sp. C2-6-M1]|nr:hypothetical protein [Algoriphagus sp. C2-6-M1]
MESRMVDNHPSVCRFGSCLISLFFCLDAKEPKSQDASKASPRRPAAWIAAATALRALRTSISAVAVYAGI